MKKIFICILLLIIVIPVFPQIRGRDIEENFSASKDTRLFLKAYGDVVISTWNRNEINVKITVSGPQKYRDLFEFELEKRNEDVRISTRKLGDLNYGIFGIRKSIIRYRIDMPSYIETQIEQEDGDTNISRLNANLEIISEDGNVFLDEIHSEQVSVETEDGDINIDDLSAELYLETEDGDIRTRKIKSDKIYIKSEDGDVELRTERSSPNGRYTIIAEDGDVDVYLDRDFKGEIDCSVEDGKITIPIVDSDVVMKSKRRLKVNINRGHAFLKINTADGDIRVK